MQYTPATAAKRLQISASSIRNYTADARFRPFFSPDATPGDGHPRLLCEDDLLVLKFIHNLTKAGIGLDAIAERLQAGELTSSSSEQLGVNQGDQAEASNAALQLLPAVFTAMQTQLVEGQARERELVQKVIDLTGEVGELKGRLAAQEGELKRLHQPKGWLGRLLSRS